MPVEVNEIEKTLYILIAFNIMLNPIQMPPLNPPEKMQRILLKNNVLTPARIRTWNRRKEIGLQFTVYTNDFNFLCNAKLKSS